MKPLKLFESFIKVFIEVRVGPEKKSEFLSEYAIKTEEDGSKSEAFMVRPDNGWPNALDTRVYFDAPDWVVESLRKLGYRIVKRQIDMDKYEGGLREYPWKVACNELFWVLVEYGYRIGQNNPVPYDLYNIRQYLEKMMLEPTPIVPGMQIRQIESENPTVEAMMLADMAA